MRVLHNGRRWWYQQLAVVSERSGLIESPAVWFINGLLWAHGYDTASLRSVHALTVAPSSCRVGDEVVPKKCVEKDADRSAPFPASRIGFVVAESNASRSTMAAQQSRGPGTVLVEFIGREFSEAFGLKMSSLEGTTTMRTRRVRVNKLAHSAALLFSEEETDHGKEASDGDEDRDIKPTSKFVNTSSAPLGDKLRSEIAAVGCLDQSAMDTVAKECKKSPDALASLFCAGLPEAVTSAIDLAAKQMNSLEEPREELFEKVAALGLLVSTIAETLYSENSDPVDDDGGNRNMEIESELLLPDSGVPDGSPSTRQAGHVAANQLRDSANEYPSNLPDLVNASLQQRRGVILSLMSRVGRRRNTGGSVNDPAERRNVSEAGVGQGTSQFGINGAPGFVFGAPSWNEDATQDLWDSYGMSRTERPPADTTRSIVRGVLESVLRCRGDSSEAVGDSLRHGRPSFFFFIRHLIARGILVDSRSWVEALVDSYQSKKNQLTPLHRQTSSFLRNAVDEEGIPLLQLAILLGCKVDLISYLIRFGCHVTSEEIRKAAVTNQPRTLALLLQHCSYSEGVIATDDCSADVRRVLEQARSRQDELDRQMRDAAGAFIVSVVRKLVSLGLLSRRNQMCSKVVCGILVGDVLLTALQRAQKSGDSSDAPTGDLTALSDRSSRVPAADIVSIPGGGVLRYLPRHIVWDSMLGDKESATSFFLLLEDYLCSRDMSDTAAGLTMLSTMLSHFPMLRSCAVLERYGLVELVSFHDVLASNKVAELLSKEFTAGLDVSCGTKGESPRLDPMSSSKPGSGVVMCPKKHTAVLHITRHSSFRCDICGCGVEKGRPMHGCRECDWDACEECTDKSESGLIKCTAIRELACGCLGQLSDSSEVSDGLFNESQAAVLRELSRDESSIALNDIAIRLLKHDVRAIRELAGLLQEPGCVTFHQFLSIALPSLHASLSGKSAENDDVFSTGRPGHKNKKARVAESSSSSSLPLDSRFYYCRESIRYLLAEANSDGINEPQSDGSAPAAKKEDSTVADEVTDAQNGPLGSTPSNSRLYGEIRYSDLASELLRRVHQVLSLYDGVELYSSSAWGRDVAASEKGDLHALTKPLQLMVEQYALGQVKKSASRRLSLSVEPLVPVSDIELHVLRSCKVDDKAYKNYCQR